MQAANPDLVTQLRSAMAGQSAEGGEGAEGAGGETHDGQNGDKKNDWSVEWRIVYCFYAIINKLILV